MKLPTVRGGSGPRFVRHTGTAAAILVADLECGIIGPPAAGSQAGADPLPFAALRVLPDGSRDPDFVLNHAPYRGASILIAGENFGAGTGTENAVRVLASAGIRVVFAPGFGAGFEAAGAAAGLLAATLPADSVEELAEWSATHAGQEMTVDLETERIERAGCEPVAICVHPRVRYKLRLGLTELDEILEHSAETMAFRRADRDRRPWLYGSGGRGSGGG